MNLILHIQKTEKVEVFMINLILGLKLGLILETEEILLFLKLFYL